MITSFKDGAIEVRGKLHEEAVYDVSNYKLSARFNGSGGVDYCLPVNGERSNFPLKYIGVVYNGEKQDVLLDKKVTMLGRRQTTEIYLKTAVLKIEMFLDRKKNAVCLQNTA